MKIAYKSIITIVLVGLFVSLMSTSVVNAQEAPEVEWEKTFGGSGSDYSNSVQQTTDGGYIIAGGTDSFGAGNYYDVYLIKTDASGGKLWEKTFGGNDYDKGYSVQQTTDGGYIIAGGTMSLDNPNDYDVYLIKTDFFGNRLWEKTFGGSNYDWGSSVQQTTDGGYIIVGGTDSFGRDIYLIKTDAFGNKLWEKTFGIAPFGWQTSVQQTTDGGYVIAGDNGYDVVLIKLRGANQPPVASFMYSPEKPLVGEQITFDASSSYDPDGTIVKYEWDFGDGNSAEGKVVTHAYTEVGNYTVNLTVTDNDGLTNSLSKVVEVKPLVVKFLDKENPSREVTGAAADGASKAIIQISDLGEGVAVSDIEITIPDQDGYLEDDKKINNGVFTQTYVAPEDFVREGHLEDPTQGKREVDLKIKVKGREIEHEPFYLFKPSVVLIHGIWSDGKKWKPLMDDLGDYYGDLIYAFDYCNSCHFEENINLISQWIDTIINTAKDHGFAKPIVIKKVDVVAHSMGGILTSLYIASDLYRNDINRLISIGTPFSGSQLANYALNFLFREMPIEDALIWIIILEVSGHSIVSGAAEDLQVGSPSINQFITKLRLFDFPVPVYAITCGGDSDKPDLLLDIVYWCLGFWDSRYCLGKYFDFGFKNVEETMFGTNDYEFGFCHSERSEESLFADPRRSFCSFTTFRTQDDKS
jgi:PKD repeat protein/pimeloyl-ACP methyl ester carboxylesterase